MKSTDTDAPEENSASEDTAPETTSDKTQDSNESSQAVEKKPSRFHRKSKTKDSGDEADTQAAVKDRPKAKKGDQICSV